MKTNQPSKTLIAMNSLRIKLFAGFIGISLFLSIALGATLYQVSNSIYYTSFLQHKKSLGISIANSIDGEIFQTFTNEHAMESTEFKRYLLYLKTVSANEDYITWIYSVLLDKKTDKLIYVIDATPIPEDTIWIENEYLGLKVYINQLGKLCIFWDSKEFSNDFEINYRNRKFIIQIQSDTGEIIINGSRVLKVINRFPFVAETNAGIISQKNPTLTLSIHLDEVEIPIFLNFASKNSPASIPGWEYIETEGLVQKIKSSIQTCTFHIQNEPEQVAYGTFIIVIAPIYKNVSECVGAIIFSVSISDINEFKNTIAIAGITTTVVALIITIVVSYLLSIFFTDPLQKLSKAVDELSSGNMETNVIIQSKDEFGFLSEKFNEMVVNLKRAYQEKESLASLRHELDVAKKIQMSILPKSIPLLQNIEIVVNYFPMTEIGGDYYDFHVVDKDKLGIFIADVSGHGIPAAIIASMLKIAFSIQLAFADDPSRLLSRINKSMLNKVGMNFITASYIFIDLETYTIKHAKAGHPSTYIYSGETGEIMELNQKGKLLGLFPEINSETVEIPIQKGDRIILYTDGIIEARNANDEMFGEELFQGYIKKHHQMKPADFSKLIISDIKSWIGNNKHNDDVTLIVVDIK